MTSLLGNSTYWRRICAGPYRNLFLRDLTGIVILSTCAIVSLYFIKYPIKLIDPDLPILDHGDSSEQSSYSVAVTRPERVTNMNDFSEAGYSSWVTVLDKNQPVVEISFSIDHDVTWYADRDEALANLEAEYAELISETEIEPNQYVITDIPELRFVSYADEYYLWCDVFPMEPTDKFVADPFNACYYLAVYGHYFSRVKMIMWPNISLEAYFSIEIYEYILNQVDTKGKQVLP